ncbi:sigma-B regulator RsbR [Halarcobacter bivalviorum]|nr:sigma-B regulator RsbR [Halarcobacter bivalviorum]
MENQAILIAEMEIPILEINEQTTLIPLIGILDSVKSQNLMENILISIKDKMTKVAIIDIEGIVIVDSAVAAHLIKITKATKLMGCTTILSGIAPEVAQTIVNLGINLDGIYTTSTLKDAIKLSSNF